LTARFAWVLNLDAELELARPGYTPAAKVREQLARFGAGSQALLGPHDALLTPSSPVAMALEPGFVGRAWCPTPLALAALRAAGAPPEPHPTTAILRRVNHRKFAFDLGGGLPAQSYLESRVLLEGVLLRREHPWLLKRPLGFAGRGQLRVYDYDKVTEKEWQWIDASLRDDGLVVEPLVEPSLEVSAHGFVFQDGHHELGRVCVQEVTTRGVFRGVRLAVSGELAPHEHDALLGRLERVAEALRGAGYFGPFGIDGYRYRQGARSGFVALSEINARYTMGFLTGFPRHPATIRIDECSRSRGEA
jgi:hypothetical protein